MNIVALAHRAAEAKLFYEAHHYMNDGGSIDRRMQLDVKSRLARDVWLKAEHDYQKSMRLLSADDLLRLSGKSKGSGCQPEP